MAEPIIQADVPTPDPSASKSAFEVLAAASPASPASASPRSSGSASPPSAKAAEPTLEKAQNAAYDEMVKGFEEAIQGTNQPAEDKPAEEAKPAVERKLPPPIKRELAPKSSKEEAAERKNITQDELQKLPFDKWPRSAQEWQKAKELSVARENELRQQVVTMQEQLKKGSPEVRQIIEERDSLRNELRQVAIERDPAFKAEFDAMEQSVRRPLDVTLGKDTADKILDSFNRLQGAARISALKKLTEDMSAFEQNAVMSSLIKYEEMTSLRAQKIADNAKNWDKLQMESRTQSEKQQAERVAAFKGALQDTFKAWTDPKEGYDFLRRTGDEKKDAWIGNVEQLADVILTGENTPDEMAHAALYAAITPHLFETLVERDNRISELEKEVASLRGVSPGPSQGGFSEEALDRLPAVSGYGDAIANAVAASGLMRR